MSRSNQITLEGILERHNIGNNCWNSSVVFSSFSISYRICIETTNLVANHLRHKKMQQLNTDSCGLFNFRERGNKIIVECSNGNSSAEELHFYSSNSNLYN